VFRLSALVTVVLDGLVQMVVGFDDALLAIVSFGDSRSRKQCQTGSQYRRSDDGFPVSQVDSMSHIFTLPLDLLLVRRLNSKYSGPCFIAIQRNG